MSRELGTDMFDFLTHQPDAMSVGLPDGAARIETLPAEWVTVDVPPVDKQPLPVYAGWLVREQDGEIVRVAVSHRATPPPPPIVARRTIGGMVFPYTRQMLERRYLRYLDNPEIDLPDWFLEEMKNV